MCNFQHFYRFNFNITILLNSKLTNFIVIQIYIADKYFNNHFRSLASGVNKILFVYIKISSGLNSTHRSI